MYAAGDWMLELFIVGMFLIPTFFLGLVIRKSETAYTRYSQALLGVSLTAPVSLGVLLIPAVNQGNTFLGWFCMDRLFASPVVVVGLAVSRLLARFNRAKRLASYGLARRKRCCTDQSTTALPARSFAACSCRCDKSKGLRRSRPKGFPAAAGSRTKVSPVNNETHLRAGVFPPH